MAKKQETPAGGPVPTSRFESSAGGVMASAAGAAPVGSMPPSWKTVSGSAFGRQNRSDGGDNPFSRPNRSEGDSAFSRPRRNEDSYGGGWAKPATVAAPPPPPNVDSEADFPTLGGKKVVASGGPKAAGFSKLASSWAAQDAAEREAAAKEKAEADRVAALEAKEAARYGHLFSRLGKSQTAYVSMEDEYDEYTEEREWNSSVGRNAFLDGGNEDNEGWSEQR